MESCRSGRAREHVMRDLSSTVLVQGREHGVEMASGDRMVEWERNGAFGEMPVEEGRWKARVKNEDRMKVKEN